MSTPKSIGSILSNNILQLNGLLPSSNNNLPEKKENSAPQQYVHPILTPEDFSNTRKNYQSYIQEYNKAVNLENFKINSYNRKVATNRRQITITRDMKIREMVWKEKNRDLEVEDYNQKVEKYNQEFGLHIRKKVTRQTVKTGTEKYFMAFVRQYNAQLYLRKKFRCSTDLQIHLAGDLPKMELCPNKIIEFTNQEGVLDFPNASVETVRHHRERLEEAGVLFDYKYHGPLRPVKIRFNKEILSITDNGKPKSARDGNQQVTQSQTKKVPHYNVSSRDTSLENTKYRDKGVAPEEKSGSTHSNCTGSSTGTPKKQCEKNFNAPATSKGSGKAEKNKNEITGGAQRFASAQNQNELSQLLLQSLEDKVDFAQELAAGKYYNYKPLDLAIAKQEAYYGTMHPKDFKELAVQDIFKFSNSIFRDLNVFPGVWMNAYKVWMTEKFKNFNGHLLKKDHLLEKWQRSIDVLRAVKRQQEKRGWIPTYPSLYFDPLRKEKCHNSFEYAFQNFRIEDPETPAAEYQKRKVNANRSARWNSDLEKARPKIRKYLRDELDLQVLMDYVKYNCREVYKNLPKLIQQEKEILMSNSNA